MVLKLYVLGDQLMVPTCSMEARLEALERGLEGLLEMRETIAQTIK